MSLDKTLNKETNERFYDYIADAWQYLLGQNFHWGYFGTDGESLDSATDNLIDMLVDRFDFSETTRVLDVGCGIGGPARYLANRHKFQLTGFSTSQEGIERARQATEEAGFSDRLSFEVRDALDNKFPSESFDSVMLLEMSHLIRDKPKLLFESTRTLKVGGVVSLCDLTLRRRLSAKEIVAYHPEIQILERCFGKARLETLDYYQGVFKNCGLEEIQQTDISEEVIPTIGHWRDNAQENRKTLLQHVQDKDVDDFIRSCDILEKLYRNGAWGYGLISGKKTAHHNTMSPQNIDNSLF